MANEFSRPWLAIDQIPSANADDVDKVLTIDEDGTPQWKDAQGGGGGGAFVLNIIYSHDDEDTGEAIYTADKTAEEILTAAASSPVVAVFSPTDGMVVQASLYSATDMGDYYRFIFYAVGADTDEPPANLLFYLEADSASDFPLGAKEVIPLAGQG